MKKILWFGLSIFAAYEIYALATKEEGDTISEMYWKFAKRPLIPFVTGMLVGHFVWQSQDVYDEKKADKCIHL